MWNILLYLLFGIGQPANTQTTVENSTVQISSMDNPDDGDGGDKGNVRPPNP